MVQRTEFDGYQICVFETLDDDILFSILSTSFLLLTCI